MEHKIISEERRAVDGNVRVRVVCECGTGFEARGDGEPAFRRQQQHADACNGSRA